MLFHTRRKRESFERSVLRPGRFELALNQMKFARPQRAKFPPRVLRDGLAQCLRQRAFQPRKRQMRREVPRSEEHTSELQSLTNLVCRLLLEKKNKKKKQNNKRHHTN